MEAFVIKTILIAAPFILAPAIARADQTLQKQLGGGIKQLSNALVCQGFAGTSAGLGKAMQRQCVQRAQAQYNAQPDVRSLKECIKPGNLIDDDVRNCMKGL